MTVGLDTQKLAAIELKQDYNSIYKVSFIYYEDLQRW